MFSTSVSTYDIFNQTSRLFPFNFLLHDRFIKLFISIHDLKHILVTHHNYLFLIKISLTFVLPSQPQRQSTYLIFLMWELHHLYVHKTQKINYFYVRIVFPERKINIFHHHRCLLLFSFPYQVKALHAAWCLLEGLIHTGYKKTQSSSLFFFLHFSLLNFTIYIHLQKEHEHPATNIPDPLPSLWNVKPAPLYRRMYIKVCMMTDRSYYKTVTWN